MAELSSGHWLLGGEQFLERVTAPLSFRLLLFPFCDIEWLSGEPASKLPMFLVLRALLRSGFGFWSALASSCALTVLLYFLAVWLLPKLGIAF